MKKTIIATIIGLMLIIAGIAKVRSDNVKYTEYVVRDGDTLWTIADDLYGEKTDIRHKIHTIRKINHINGYINPGDIIFVPEK